MADQTAQASAPVGMRAAWGVAGFRHLAGAFALSRTGDHLFSVALIVYVLEQTGSAGWVAALVVLRLLPLVIVGPFAGVLADRMPRRRLMVATDLVRLALMGVLVALVLVDVPLWLIVAVTVLAGVVGTPYSPSFAASVPSLVGERELAGANALVSVVDYVASVLGPALGAIVAGHWGLVAALLLNAATFAGSALLLVTGPGRREAALDPVGAADDSDAASAEDSDEVPQGLGHQLADGVRAVAGDRVLRVLVAAVVLSTFAMGFESVYLVLVSRDLLGTGASGVGWLDASVGVGGVLGALVVSRLAASSRPRLVLAWVSLLSMLPMAGLAFVSHAPVAYVLLLVEGAAGVALDVVGITTMQRNVPDALLARADALISACAVAAVMLGSLLAPVLLSAVGLQTALVVAACVPAALVLLLVATLRDMPETPELSADRAAVLALLERIPALRELAAVQRDQLAVAAQAVDLVAGDEVTRQGDAPDVVWLLATGSCAVLVTDDQGEGRVVSQVSAPDLIGEIGVVEQRPRTATVVARTPCTGYRVPAGTFRDALSVGQADLPTLRATIGSRLARSLS